MSRKTFDSVEYYKAKNNFDGFCLGCGKKIGFSKYLILTKKGDLRDAPIPNKFIVCDYHCERLFIKKTIKDWSKVREIVFSRDNFTCQDCHKSYTIKFIKVYRPEKFPTLSDVERDPQHAEKMMKKAKIRAMWKFTKEPIPLEAHHIIPISEGGPEFDLDNLVTLCFECHHLGRHGSKAPTSEEIAQDRLQARRSQHICLERFSEAA